MRSGGHRVGDLFPAKIYCQAGSLPRWCTLPLAIVRNPARFAYSLVLAYEVLPGDTADCTPLPDILHPQFYVLGPEPRADPQRACHAPARARVAMDEAQGNVRREPQARGLRFFPSRNFAGLAQAAGAPD